MQETVKLNGKRLEVRADYRKIMAVIRVLSDQSMEMLPQARVMSALRIFYVDFDSLTDHRGALEVMREFIDGASGGKSGGPRLIDFTKDWKHIVAAVNKSSGQPIRNMDFLHIEDFLGYLQERDPESTMSHIINIRYAIATGKFNKLSKELKEFYYKNREDIDLAPVEQDPAPGLSDEEQAKVLEEFYAMRR